MVANSGKLRLGEFLAEFVGTFVLILFGDASVAQNLFYGPGDFLDIGWSWSIGLFVAILIAGRISGAHVNPAITIALMVTDRQQFPILRGLNYICAQFLGAFFGAMAVYVLYYQAISHLGVEEERILGVFCTYPSGGYNFLDAWGCLFTEVLATFVLAYAVYSLGDPLQKLRSQREVGLFGVPLILLGISQAFGKQTGYALNPARDLSPRLWIYLMGYEEAFMVPDSEEYYFWIPVVGPIVGAVLGGVAYRISVGYALRNLQSD